ncbi:capsule assembly Wzi family protein [Mucilaginibacter sp. HC2]|uniref:capsule assembly Wzi family protein n=1 Tax=Mucilaginibacter inviolabilis TaxID=2714892 RepID=UPI00140883B7|nr:capsule assembly Wzi family protein [Mucilaginibacter inviolabilis]NHA06022.1 capsule assembly Wzi family protein [Mucilaginibacter inviolabilis]
MKKIFTCVILLFLISGVVKAQSVYQPYSYQFYQKLDADVYSTKTRLHSSLKPFFVDDSLVKHHYDSLMNLGGLKGKFFTQHQIDVQGKGYTFYTDLLPDFNLSRDFSGKRNTNSGSLGLQVGGTVGNKLSYNVSAYENRAVLPEYLSTYTNQVGIIPGQAYAALYGNEYRWSYITALVSYTPNKYLNITAGRDKTFIGDGYRSELLSDYASPYPFVKLTATLGNVRYMAMWAYFNDPLSVKVDGGDRKKYGVFHYLDWNVSNRLSFGFFDAVIWPAKDDLGHQRGFDFTYINPVIFLRPVEATNGSPDNALIGLTGKYKLTDGVTVYGQFALDEFESKNFFSSNGSSRNKYGWQLGLRGANLFNVSGLNYLLETNNVKPYTYSERSSIVNYSENGEPLAHPWGANFREVVGLLNYSYKRFDFSGELDYGHYGLDMNNLNYGKDIFQQYVDPARAFGNYTGQGLTTNMVYVEGKVAYLLNPKYNLRFELGGLYRSEKNSQFHDKTGMLTFGIRSSFRAIYNDLASYKTH